MSLFDDNFGVRTKYKDIGKCSYALFNQNYVGKYEISDDILKETYTDENFEDKVLNLFNTFIKKHATVRHIHPNEHGEIWRVKVFDILVCEFYLRYYESV